MSSSPEYPDPEQAPLTTNPYAPTSFVSDLPTAEDDVEAYRRRFLSHEASIKSIGMLYILGAIFLVPMGFFAVISAVIGVATGPPEPLIFIAIFGTLYLVLGIVQGFTGVGIRRFAGWARIVTIVFSAIGLIGFPIGTMISAYFLYLLLSEKGKVVFSDHYQEVIRQTPHIKYKTSIIVWIFLGILVAACGLVIAAVAAGLIL